MNKRGDIPVTILVIGVLGICILAILSFKFSFGARSGLSEISAITDVVSISGQVSFYESKNINFNVLKKSPSGSVLHQYPDFYLRKNNDGSYSVRKELRNPEGIEFIVEYTFTP